MASSVRNIDHLRERARSLPESPGVYFWRDAAGQILYIGKAVNLRARVTSYFSTAIHDRRTRELVMRSRSIDFEVTATELEALFRESALIKREQPAYNRALKTTRLPWYLKLDASLLDPYLEATRQVLDDGSLYIGPFRSGAVLRETTEYLHAVLPLRKCTAKNPHCRPCIYHQMGTCAAPFLDAEHRNKHEEAMRCLVDILDGRSERVEQRLQCKRDRLSESLLFEQAAEIQVRIEALRDIRGKQAILDVAAQSRCVLICEETTDSCRILLVARGTVVFVRHLTYGDVSQVLRWVRLHEPILRRTKEQQTEVDAATVLERWLAVHRGKVRWAAMPQEASDDDLSERISEVLGGSPLKNLVPSESR